VLTFGFFLSFFPNSSWSNRLIGAKDHAAIQLNVGHLDDKGVFTGKYTTFAIGGSVRHRGESDSGLDHLWQKKKAELGQ
jgi:small subunit ribosomal protein S21e